MTESKRPELTGLGIRESFRDLGITHKDEMVPVETSPRPLQALLYNCERFDMSSFWTWLLDRPHIKAIAEKRPPNKIYRDTENALCYVTSYSKDGRWCLVRYVDDPELALFERSPNDLRDVTAEIKETLT